MHSDERPRSHLTPPRAWMNDPNGPIFVDGRWHVFYQHDPVAPRWDRVHWGHAVTADMVEWLHLPIAISPDDDGPDALGCWSGCVVEEDGVATMFYTGVVQDGPVRRASILRATSVDGLVTWAKDRSGPAIAGAPAGIAADAFRDPFVIRDGTGWVMLVGGGTDAGLGAVLLYRSPDRMRWDFVGPFLSADDVPRAAGADGPCWECPQLLRFAGADVLIVSVVDRTPGVRPSHVMAFVGRMGGDRFVVDHADQLDMGPDFYAPAAVVAPDGRRLIIGWIPEDPPGEASARDWAGSMTYPRVISIETDGRLGMALADEILSLRGPRRSSGPHVLVESRGPWRRELTSQHVEVRLTIDPGDAMEVAIELLDSDPDSAEVRVAYQPAERVLSVARRGIVTVAGRGSLGATTLPTSAGHRLELRLLIDGSVLELEAAGHTMGTVRLSAMHGPRQALTVAAVGGGAVIESIDMWELTSGADRAAGAQADGTRAPDQWRMPSRTPSAKASGER
ncbi:MAG: glycoside hydrolase family 32 protein [Chloroflexota bacterium]